MKSPSRLFAICLAAACLGATLLASIAQAAAPAWAPIAASGPTNLPPVQSEIQRITVDAEGGAYTLTHATASGSGTLTGATVTGAITAGSNKVTAKSGSLIPEVSGGTVAVGAEIVGPGIPGGTTITAVQKFFGTLISLTISANATESHDPVSLRAGSREVTSVTSNFGSFTVGDEISATGVPAGTMVDAIGTGTLTLSTVPASSGNRVLTAIQTTGPLAYNASASELEAGLSALPALDVTVKGGPGDKGATKPYFVTFGGDLAHKDVLELSADSDELTGGHNRLATVTTALDGGPGMTEIVIYPQNVGGAPSSGTTTLRFELPTGITTSATPAAKGVNPWSCSPTGAGKSLVTCTSAKTAGPGLTLPPLVVPVIAGESATSDVVPTEMWGGGTAATEAAPVTYDMPLTVSLIPAPPGVQAFTAATYDENGMVDQRAGAHPYSASSGILINTKRSPRGRVEPAGEFRDIVVDTPPGFIGNPIATPQCPEAFEQQDCPQQSIVATTQIPLNEVGVAGLLSSVNNIEAPFGFPAKFRFQTGFGQIVINVAASLRSDEDYGLEVGSYNTPQIEPVFGAFFTIWGVPFDEGHDGQRCVGPENAHECLSRSDILAAGGKEVAFLTNPVDCAEEALRTPTAALNVNTWQNPSLLFSHAVPLKPVTGCDELDFEVDKFAFEPGTDDADSPASFTTELELPSEGLTDPEKRMNPTIKQTVLDLPEGVVLNASAADGLEACSFEEIGYKGNDYPRPNEIRFDREPNNCPNASKIGTGELKSSLLAETLSADLFLAEQGDDNPFGSLFAIYLVVESEERGLNIKLPGEVQLDEDGQQKIVFRDLPPLPFDSLELKLKGGDRSPLATPTTCGDYTTKATNTPWSAPESGPPLTSRSEFDIDDGPGGGDCADSPGERPFALGLRAGTGSVQAGAFSPLTLQVTRPDGAQELNTLEFAPPPGLAASLKGIPYCPEAAIAAAAGRDGEDEQDRPSCPAASRVGRALAGAGSGPRPFYAPGELYLAGPYKGAPLSILAITPAVAGPFDLGNVIVRSAIFVNPVTAQVSARTDPLPQVVKGVPLRIRDVRVILDRPGFALNPSGCEEKAIAMRATGASGAVTDLVSRFQVGNCGALGFKPRMNLRLFGGVKRGKYQGLRAVVRPRPGDANISRTVVRMPRSAFLAQEHIRTVCTRVQFAANACPKGAIYGKAIAWSPLLDYPLQGNVYLRSSDNELPDVVADLRGPAHQPIRVEVVGRTDSVKGALRNTFDVVPDAPVSYFRLQLFGGKKGLIVNSRNICRGKNRAGVRLDAHNGRRALLRPALRNKRCAMLRKKQRKAAKRSAYRSKRPGA